MQIDHPDLEVVAACRDPQKLLPAYRGEVRKGDLRDEAYLDRVLVGIDIICHTAGWINFTNDTAASRKQVLEPTLELINHAIEWRVSRFVNLSSLAVVPVEQRNNEESAGKPQKHCAMLNCLIGIEDYMRAHATSGCSFVNLRAGILCGRRMNYGFLPVLIELLRHSALPLSRGKHAYLPIIDGRDLAQGLIRASLAPELPGYAEMSLVSDDCPTHAEILTFMRENLDEHIRAAMLPDFIVRRMQHLLFLKNPSTRLHATCTLLSMLHNPQLKNSKARDTLGFDPEISWQASLTDYLAQPRTTIDSLKRPVTNHSHIS